MALRVHVPALVVVTLATSVLASGQPPVRSQPAQTNPPRDVQAAQTGTAVIGGRILAADDGGPRLRCLNITRRIRLSWLRSDGRLTAREHRGRKGHDDERRNVDS